MTMNRQGHVRQVLDDLLAKWEKGEKSKGNAVREAWAQAVGEEIKKNTRPVSLKNNIMVVIVEESSWLYKLTLEKRNILNRFNEHYRGRKKPAEIRFRIGSLDDQ